MIEGLRDGANEKQKWYFGARSEGAFWDKGKGHPAAGVNSEPWAKSDEETNEDQSARKGLGKPDSGIRAAFDSRESHNSIDEGSVEESWEDHRRQERIYQSSALWHQNQWPELKDQAERPTPPRAAKVHQGVGNKHQARNWEERGKKESNPTRPKWLFIDEGVLWEDSQESSRPNIRVPTGVPEFQEDPRGTQRSAPLSRTSLEQIDPFWGQSAELSPKNRTEKDPRFNWALVTVISGIELEVGGEIGQEDGGLDFLEKRQSRTSRSARVIQIECETVGGETEASDLEVLRVEGAIQEEHRRFADVQTKRVSKENMKGNRAEFPSVH